MKAKTLPLGPPSLSCVARSFWPVLLLVCLLAFGIRARAQTETTSAIDGTVTDSLTTRPVPGARVEILNVETNRLILKTTDARGRFYEGLLAPGLYRIRVTMPNYQTFVRDQRLRVIDVGQLVPVPVALEPAPATPPPPPAPVTAGPLIPPPPPIVDVRTEINTRDARRGGSFTEEELTRLPIGAASFTRSFDELSLLLPGVAPPPQTLGSVAGPGQGTGVGTAGQFAVNGLRSRANNFTVDGSDNNDEDIGVRRQGFVALVPQPVESVKEYQAITLLAPAQFGRNLGAQVNAVSRSGGSQTHGAAYGFFNSSQLNARNFFDTALGRDATPLLARDGRAVLLDNQPLTVRNQSGGEDSFTFAQAGFTLGGRALHQKTFYFLSAETQIINANREESFAVPTVEQRGIFGSGASGIAANPFTGQTVNTLPADINGAMLFSLFPFANNSRGIYGANTFTQQLPASARGAVASLKLDRNFKLGEREQSLVGRFNFTDDRRDIPASGEALFSALRPRVRAQNLSLFLNSALSSPGAAREKFNQVRLSYGRTRLRFEEALDRLRFNDARDALPAAPTNFPGVQFLLNAPVIVNQTTPAADGTPSRTVNYFYRRTNTGELVPVEAFGPLGQVVIAGFSPVGVDVYNFPQRRVNNTYQLADAFTLRAGTHDLGFGADVRRSDLNSDLPRLSRPLAVFNGGPRLAFSDNAFRPLPAGAPFAFVRPEDLAAVGAASSFFLTLNNGVANADLSLRYYQINLYAQDVWRITDRLSLSYGLRYEHNTPAREVNRRVEKTFNSSALDLAGARGLRQFIEERQRIFEPDFNNFAPRVNLAYAPNWLGPNRVSVMRAGYGRFYDQILGAVVSQSRNVYPSFLSLNFAGGRANDQQNLLGYNNPSSSSLNLSAGNLPLVTPGTVNQLNPNLPLNQELLSVLREIFPGALELTLPRRRLPTPSADHYSFSFEQQLSRGLTVTVAYVGTTGRNLLRFTTPNLGASTATAPDSFTFVSRLDPFTRATLRLPQLRGRLLFPGTSIGATLSQPNNRPVPDVGAVTIFETTAGSRYDALQVQLRSRFRQSFELNASYAFSSARDDVSDVFDLAGASALPQNSLTFAGERGPANFDLRHRLTAYLTYDLSPLATNRWRWLLGGLQVAASGFAQSGQPFTVNSIFDINLDGNLTDRLNSTSGLDVTGDRLQPLRLTTANTLGLLAAPGNDGRVERNNFRAGGTAEVDLALFKRVRFAGQSLTLRVDVFNLFNRSNFGVPVRLLEAPGFGQAKNTVTPNRRVQFGLKYEF